MLKNHIKRITSIILVFLMLFSTFGAAISTDEPLNTEEIVEEVLEPVEEDIIHEEILEEVIEEIIEQPAEQPVLEVEEVTPTIHEEQPSEEPVEEEFVIEEIIEIEEVPEDPVEEIALEEPVVEEPIIEVEEVTPTIHEEQPSEEPVLDAKEIKKQKIDNTDKLHKDLKDKLKEKIDNPEQEEKKLLILTKDFKDIYAVDLDLVDIDSVLDLANNPDVELIMEDPILGIKNTDVIDIINSPETNALTEGGIPLDGTGSAICLVDTGVNYNHQDLTGFIVNGPDYVNDDADSMDDNGHGTHIAGTIHAIAPNAQIISVKVCNAAGGCGGFDMIQGVQWCMDHKDEYNLKAISISIGDYAEWTDATCPTWMDGTLEWAHDENIFTTAASGNEGYTSGINYPACSSYVTSVGASTKADAMGVPTNRGPNLDLMAPGAMIISADYADIEGYIMKSGTSMATPVVATSGAILKKYYEDNSITKTPDELKQLMKDTGVDVAGYPRVDLLAAVEVDALYDGNEPPIPCGDIPNMISYWSFDNADASDDLEINSGTIYGPTITTGKADGALLFDGSDDYVEINDNPTLDMTNELTLEAWVNPEEYAGWGMGIIDKSTFDGAGGNYRLAINYIENRAYFRIKIKDLIIDQDITSTNAIPLDEWTHIAATYDGSSMKIYINGELDTEKSVTGEMVTDTYKVRLGQYLGSNRFFKGKIDEVAIFSRALTLTEIQSAYDNGAANKNICTPGPGGMVSQINDNPTIDDPLKDIMISMIVNSEDAAEDEKVLVIANAAEAIQGLEIAETAGKFAVVSLNHLNEVLDLANNPDVEWIMKDPVLGIENSDVIDIINSPETNILAVNGNALDGTDSAICLIDTGVNYNHQDLTGFIVNGPDYVNDDADSMDDNGHGTHIAGTIHAIAPNAQIISVKVCNAAGGCGGFDMIQGVQWCMDHKDEYNLKAISISIGDYAEWTDADCPTWMDGTLEWAHDENIFTTAASGNEGYTAGINYPACSIYTTSVGASTKADAMGVPTNRGPNLDLMAPGAMIISADYADIEGYIMKSGTSMATPVVATSGAILKKYYEDNSITKTPDELKQLMKDTGVDVTGYPRIDLLAAVEEDGLYGNVSAMCGLVLTENTTLTEDLNCVGDDKDYALNINTSGVVLDCNGHTITGDSKYGVYGYKRNTILDNVEIKNCKLQGFETGIRVQNFNESTILNNNVSATLHAILISGPVDYSVVTIKNNIVTGETGIGLYFYRVKDSLIEDNFVDGGKSGLYMSRFENNLVQNNDILGTSGTGMHIKPGKNNTFKGNNVSDGNLGIRLFYQGSDSSDGNVFDDNTITNNDWMGFWIYSASVSGTVDGTEFINNYVENNNQVAHGGWHNAQVKIQGTNSLVKNNTIKNSPSGECILIQTPNAANNWIVNNTIDNCQGESGSGVRLRDGTTGDIVEGNTISNSVRGIYIWQGSETVIRNNEIFGMSFSAIPLSSKTGTDFEIYGNNIHDNLWGIYFSDINHVDVHDNLIIDNDKAGIMYRGILNPAVYDDLKVYNNNIYNNTVNQVIDDGNWGAREMSYNNEGNYWGRDAGQCFISGNDSNKAWITDSFCYLSISGWEAAEEAEPVQETPPAPQVSSSSGGGSSKKSTQIIMVVEPEVCNEDWICAPWSECSDGAKSRICEDWNKCGTTEFKPGTSKVCTEEVLTELTVEEGTSSLGTSSTDSRISSISSDSAEENEETPKGLGAASSFISKVNPINIFNNIINFFKNLFS